jgi:DNA polymerase-3 subunit gamma/tau
MEQQSFIVSARKYRPQRWDTVVGQSSVTDTLRKAVSNNEIGQAYLFCGPRGVGKTTCARIFARAINTGDAEASDASVDLDIMESGNADDEWAFNVFELDGASNNKVDDIKGLIDQVRIPPQRGKYKVYIIDEVHMLSTQAFNAFLKTLEEPPPHAVFILATTEKHKVIPTILSRCQIFDFNRITVAQMVEHLQKIVTNKGINAETEALHVIAQKADGAMRDALSIFDQAVAITDGNLTYETVTRSLNVLGHELYFKLTDQILAENIPDVLKELNEVVSKGFDLHHFLIGLGEHFRKLMLAHQPETVQLLEIGDDFRQRYVDQAKRCELAFLQNALHTLNETEIDYRRSQNPRLHTELCLMKLCSIQQRIREKKKGASL